MEGDVSFPNQLAGIKDCTSASGSLVDAAPRCVPFENTQACDYFTFSSGADAQGAWPGRKIRCSFNQETQAGDETCCSAALPCPGRGPYGDLEDATTVEVTLPAGATSPTIFYSDWDGPAFGFITGDIQ